MLSVWENDLRRFKEIVEPSPIHRVEIAHMPCKTKVIVVIAAVASAMLAFAMPLYAVIVSHNHNKKIEQAMKSKMLAAPLGQIPPASPEIPTSIPTTPTAIIGTIAVMAIGFLLWLLKWLFTNYTELVKQMTPLTEAIKSLEIKVDGQTRALERNGIKTD